MPTTVTIHHIDGDKAYTRSISVGDTALAKVLFGFNVTDDPRVTALKALSAAQIQMMIEHQASLKSSTGPISNDDEEIRQARKRAASIAITQVELTQMPLVKALFAKA